MSVRGDKSVPSAAPLQPYRQLRNLVLGYGNPGRQDDGLGPAAASEIGRMDFPNVTAHENGQLVIEDAVDVAETDVVWFIDASRTGVEPYTISYLVPAREVSFTTHLVKPEVILALVEGYYGKSPQAYLVSIRGYEFEFADRLTLPASRNLRAAVTQIISVMKRGQEVQQ